MEVPPANFLPISRMFIQLAGLSTLVSLLRWIPLFSFPILSKLSSFQALATLGPSRVFALPEEALLPYPTG